MTRERGFNPEMSRGLAAAALLVLVLAGVVVWSLYDGLLGGFRKGDFNFLHAAGQVAWEARFADAYTLDGLEPRNVIGTDEAKRPLLFTYPPPVGFAVVPLGAMPRDMAYAAFVGGTGLLFVVTLARLAAGYLPAVLLAGLPILTVTVLNGQTSLLTGALAGLTCLGCIRARAWAGVPLGLLVMVKPHVAPALVLVLIATRRWAALGAAAAAASAAAAGAALAFGPDTWAAFARAGEAAAAWLGDGRLPLHRMVTPFALAATAGLGPTGAMALQVAAAAAATAAVGACALGGRPPRQAAGIAAVLAPAFSPYLYDYDLTVVLAGLACLWADLARRSHWAERLLLAGALWLATIHVFAPPLLADGGNGESATVGALALPAVFYLLAAALVALILRRDGPAAESRPAAA